MKKILYCFLFLFLFGCATSTEDQDKSATLQTANTLKEEGDSLFESKKYDEALLSYLKSRELMEDIGVDSIEDYIALLNDIGDLYYTLNEYNNAIETYIKSIKSNDDPQLENTQLYAFTFYRMGMCSYRLKEYDSALEQLSESASVYNVIQTNEQDNNVRIDIYDRMAQIYFKSEQYSEALESHKKMLTIWDENNFSKNLYYSRTLCNLGYSSFYLNQFSDSLEYNLKSIEVLKNLPEIHYDDLCNRYLSAGLADIELGNYEDAISFYNQSNAASIEDSGDKNSYTLYALAIAYCLLGNNDESLIYLNEAFELGHNKIRSRESIESEKHLEGLRSDFRFKDLLDKYY